MINRPDTPRGWHNKLSNGQFTATISQTGSGTAFDQRGRTATLLRGSRQVASEQLPGRIIYLFDNDSGEFWSIGHFPGEKAYQSFQAVHGLGYTTISSGAQDIDSGVTFFVPSDDACEIWQLKISNTKKKKRRLSIFLVTNIAQQENSDVQLKNNILYANSKDPSDNYLTYFGLSHAVDSFDSDREMFFGPYGSFAAPRAIADGKCSRSVALNDPILVLQRNITLGAQAQTELTAIFGGLAIDEALGSFAQARANAIRKGQTIVEKYIRANSAEQALAATRSFWSQLVDASQLSSPDETLNLSQTVWAKYQTITNFLTVESIEFSASLAKKIIPTIALTPKLVVERTAALLARQAKEGRMVEWLDYRSGVARLSDSVAAPAWLGLAVIALVNETGEIDWLRQQIGFFDGGSASVSEHLVRAAEHCLRQCNSNHLVADGEFESTEKTSLVAMFLKELIPVLEHLHDHQAVRKYQLAYERIKEALSKRLWDGGYYLAGRNGKKIGSPKNPQRKIDLAAQVWPVLAGLAIDARAEKALNAAWRTLRSTNGLASFSQPFPGFDTEEPASQFAPGEKTNGGISIELAALAATAEAKLGRGELVYQILQDHHFAYRSTNQVKYKIEPFVYPEYIFGSDNSRFGEGDGAWGTAGGWQRRTVGEALLGVKPVLGGLRIDPCLPRDWRQVEVSRQFRGAEYHIRIMNPTRQTKGVDRIVVDGIRQTGNVIPAFKTGIHYIEVFLG